MRRERRDDTRRRHRQAPRVSSRRALLWLLTAAAMLAACERTPSKADYVDEQVRVQCAEQRGEAFKLCRIGVIKQFLDVPLEEMQKRFPPPPTGRSKSDDAASG